MDKVIGCRIEELDTPALLLDWTLARGNIGRMAEFFRGRACRLRPHFKNHKCPALARHQVEAGQCAGLTCAKLGEAEVLAEHGFDDVLIANQVVGRPKIERLVALARRIRVQVAVDDAAQAATLAEAAAAAGATLGVLIEIDVGMGRCGVAPGEPALALARHVEGLPGLRFDGLQAYEGHAVYTNDLPRRAEMVRLAFGEAVRTRQLIESDGIPVRTISGGSSSTYRIAAEIAGVGEIQAGTYPTMDWRYAAMSPEFDVALSVLARVVSARPGTAVLDVGAKGLGSEFGPPRIQDHPEVETPAVLAEEHCVVQSAPRWRVGEVVRVLPSHACTTCNLYRQLYVHQDGRVIDAWPIAASGKLA